MKRISISLMAVLLCVLSGGCRQQLPAESSPSAVSDIPSDVSSDISSDDPSEEAEKGVEIVDKDGTLLGRLPEHTGTTLTNSGIFFTTDDTVFSDTITAGSVGEEDTTIVSYHLYDMSTRTTYDFGSIPGQDYEAGYARTELNEKLYTLVTTGNALDSVPDPLLLAEFDLSAHTIRSYTISDNGFPYTFLTEVNGKLLILNHDQTDILRDILYLFDPETGDAEQVMQFALSDDNGDTVRAMYSDGTNVYLLRLHFQDKQVRMFLDTYDLTYHKQSETEVTSLFRKSIGEPLIPVDVENEMKQMVSRFLVMDKQVIYYENFSTTRLIGNLKTEAVQPESVETGDLFAASSGSGAPFFYTIFGGNHHENELFEWKNGTLEKTIFRADDDRYYLTAASVSPNGKRLLRVEYVNPEDRNDSLPEKLYYL